MKRKESIVPNEIYHVCNKSISNYRIFNKPKNVMRFIYTLDYYNNIKNSWRFSDFLKKQEYSYENLLKQTNASFHIKFLAYCIMPDHYHLLIKTQSQYFISYISKVENSYSRYFNIKNKRKGPLWQSRFRIVLIESDEQLLHVTRYIHLNPTTSSLIKKPEDWIYSSYNDYISNPKLLKKNLKEITIRNPKEYKEFVENQIDYQRRLKRIKNLILE